MIGRAPALVLVTLVLGAALSTFACKKEEPAPAPTPAASDDDEDKPKKKKKKAEDEEEPAPEKTAEPVASSAPPVASSAPPPATATATGTAKKPAGTATTLTKNDAGTMPPPLFTIPTAFPSTIPTLPFPPAPQ